MCAHTHTKTHIKCVCVICKCVCLRGLVVVGGGMKVEAKSHIARVPSRLPFLITNSPFFWFRNTRVCVWVWVWV
jgi:hypothetical protein